MRLTATTDVSKLLQDLKNIDSIISEIVIYGTQGDFSSAMFVCIYRFPLNSYDVWGSLYWPQLFIHLITLKIHLCCNTLAIAGGICYPARMTLSLTLSTYYCMKMFN